MARKEHRRRSVSTKATRSDTLPQEAAEIVVRRGALGRRMIAKRAGSCARCVADIAKGDVMYWVPGHKARGRRRARAGASYDVLL